MYVQDELVDASQIDSDSDEVASPVDSRIRWIHFILGCSVLLSWNGTLRIYCTLLNILTKRL